jgi:hypothetical protein
MRYNSFVFRLWQTERESNTSDESVHGRIEHIQSGVIARVADLDEITAFIRQCLDAIELDSDEDQI